MVEERSCRHSNLTCINHYELIRKYRCADCGGVMVCKCDEEFGRRCLPHQIGRAHLYGSHRFEPVTLGFVRGVCNSCRGLPDEPHPMAESWGRSSKLARFYWREIGRTILDRFDAWSRTQGFDGWVKASKATRGC